MVGVRHLPNVLTVHSNELKRDMESEMRRVAGFSEIVIDETRWSDILTYCSVDWMKHNAAHSVPLGGAVWDRGAKVFMHRGVNGR